MIRKVLALTGAAAGVISFAMVVGEYGASPALWALGSFAPPLLLAALFIYLKRNFLQSALVPFLLFFGIAGLSVMPRQVDYAFGLAMAVLMILMAAYILSRQLFRVRFFRTAAALALGVALFFAVQYIRYNTVEDQMDIAEVREAERTLFSR